MSPLQALLRFLHWSSGRKSTSVPQAAFRGSRRLHAKHHSHQPDQVYRKHLEVTIILSTHSVGDTFNVTVKNNAGQPSPTGQGTATVVDDGGVGKLNHHRFFGNRPTLPAMLTVNVVSPPITPTLPASVSFGTNYAPLENPTITVTKPDSSTQALAAADVTNNGDGTLTVSLANVLMAGVGNYAVGASNGAIRLLPHGSGSSSLNDKGTGYAAGESVSFVSTSSSGITYGGAATATVDVAGRIDVDASGITPTSTGTLTLVFDGPLQGPATLTNVGSGYDTSETAPTVTITNGTGDKGTLAGTATINGDGTLNITFANNASAKGHSQRASSQWNFLQDSRRKRPWDRLYSLTYTRTRRDCNSRRSASGRRHRFRRRRCRGLGRHDLYGKCR